MLPLTWQTYHNHYLKISLEKLLKATSEGEYVNYKIKDLIDNPPENLNVTRLYAKTP